MRQESRWQPPRVRSTALPCAPSGRDLRQRVLAAAERLQYVPDANAQAMARGRTSSLGLIVGDIADPYFSSIAAGVADAAERASLAVTLACTHHHPLREAQFVEVLTRQRARAIVIAGGRRDDDEADALMRRALEGLRRSGGSTALIGQPLLGVNTVVIANCSGAAALAHALYDRGYRRFAVLAGPLDHLTARDRCAGFSKALDELGCPVAADAMLSTAFTRDGGQQGMRVQQRDGAPEVGVRVPDDVAVAGFDDIVTLRDTTPSLSSVRVPLVDIGIAATGLALAAPSDEPRLMHVDGTVVLRDSTPGRPIRHDPRSKAGARQPFSRGHRVALPRFGSRIWMDPAGSWSGLPRTARPLHRARTPAPAVSDDNRPGHRLAQP